MTRIKHLYIFFRVLGVDRVLGMAVIANRSSIVGLLKSWVSLISEAVCWLSVVMVCSPLALNARQPDRIRQIDSLLLRYEPVKALELIDSVYYGTSEPGVDQVLLRKVHAFIQLENYDDALIWSDSLMRLPIGDSLQGANQLFRALIYEIIGDTENCEIALNTAFDVIRKWPGPGLYAEYLIRKTSYFRVFDYESEAATMVDSAVSFTLRNGLRNQYAVAILLKAFLEPDIEKRLEYLRRAKEVFVENNNPHAAVPTVFAIASTYFETGEVSKADQLCDSILNTEPEPYNLYVRYRFYQLKAECDRLLDRPDSAYVNMQRCVDALIEFQNYSDYEEALFLSYQTKAKRYSALFEKSRSELDHLGKNIKQLLLTVVIILLMLGVIVVQYILLYRSKNALSAANNKLMETNMKLTRSLNLNKVYLMELQHRVKNNLTMLKGLFFLQSREVKNEDAREVLEEMQVRIDAVARIHDRLGDLNRPETMDPKMLIEELCRNICIIFDMDGSTDVSVEVDEGIGKTRYSVHLWMILAELIINSFKHAFEYGKHSDRGIFVRLEKVSDGLMLSYSDSGSGIDPEQFNNGGLGSRLIRLLVVQLNGSISFRPDADTMIQITLPSE